MCYKLYHYPKQQHEPTPVTEHDFHLSETQAKTRLILKQVVTGQPKGAHTLSISCTRQTMRPTMWYTYVYHIVGYLGNCEVQHEITDFVHEMLSVCAPLIGLMHV